MWYLWVLPVVLVVFLWALIEHLSGLLKDAISGVLILIAVGLIVAAFVVSGWRAGVASLVAAPVSVLAVIPVARSLARRSSGYSDPRIEEYNRRQMDELRDAARGGDLLEVMERHASIERQHMEQAVGMAIAQPSIAKALADRGCDRRDLEALYRRIEIQMLPPELREVALKNPAVIGFFLDNSTPSTAEGEYRRDVNDGSTHIWLSLWVSHDPAAATPPRY